MGAARHRVLAQLASVAECVQGMAATGLLHTDLDAGRTLQTSARQPERDGEWTAETIVTRLPPKAMITAQWSPELCQTVMSAAVVMSVVERDYRSELVEYRELAGDARQQLARGRARRCARGLAPSGRAIRSARTAPRALGIPSTRRRGAGRCTRCTRS